MRILALFIVVAVTTALMIGSVVLLVVSAPRISQAILLVESLGLGIAIVGPLLIGSFLAYRGGHPIDPGELRSRRRGLVVVLTVEIAALITVVIGADLGNAAPWFVPSIIALVVLLTAAYVLLGRLLSSYAALHPESPLSEYDLSRGAQLKRVRRIAILFFAGLVVGLLLNATQQALNPNHPRDLAATVFLCVIFGCIVGAFTTLGSYVALGRRAQESVGPDFATRQRINRVVVKGVNEPLNDDELMRARRYAAYCSLYFRYQVAFFAFMFAGLVGDQLVIAMGGTDPYVAYLGGAMLVLFFAVLPMFVRRIRRVSRYAAEHPMVTA